MTFTRVDPGNFYRTIRLLSDTGRWELGMEDYASGTRLRMGLTGKPPSVFDFCMGTDPANYAPILVAVLKRLETMSENSSRNEIDQTFPWAGHRPDLNLHWDALLSPMSATAM